jgi:hypothetical protein
VHLRIAVEDDFLRRFVGICSFSALINDDDDDDDDDDGSGNMD